VGAGTGLGILDKRMWNVGSSSRQRYKPYNLISSLHFILRFTSHIQILKFFSKTYPCLLFPFQYHFPNYALSPSGLLTFFFFCMCFSSLPRILQFNHSNNIYRAEHAMHLLVTQFSLVTCHNNSLRSKSSNII